MKKILSIFYFVVLVSVSFIVVGCTNENSKDNSSLNEQIQIKEQTQLVTPILKWENNIIKWNKIDNAITYNIIINGEEFSTANDFFHIDITNEPAEYRIKVKAIANNINFVNSDYSEELIIQSQQLQTPDIYTIQGDHNFEIDDTGNFGTIKFTTFPNTDYINLFVNGDKYTYELTNILTITSEMCNAGYNDIKIQACSNNTLYFDSNYLTTTIYKESTPTNVRIENGNIVYNFPTIIYQQKHYDYLGYGNIRVPVRNYSYMQSLNSDSVYINVYRTKPLKTRGINCTFNQELYEYQCSVSLVNDVALDISTGSDYNKLEVIVYTYQNQNYKLTFETQNIHELLEFSVSGLFPIKEISFRLYNDKHIEYLNTTTILKNI